MHVPNQFFVLHLPENWPGKSASNKYEIQLVNREGQAIAWRSFGDMDVTLHVGDIAVPTAVLEAARRQAIGTGDFVDENGKQVLPTEFTGDKRTIVCPEDVDER